MIHPELLKIMCCPETHQAISLASPATIQQVNQEIESKKVFNRAGKEVTEKLESGLVRADGRFLYPIRNQIPVMLIDEAIPLR